MNALVGSWKTSLVGILSGAMILVAHTYQPGMTFKRWGLAILQAGSLALVGIFAQDHKKP